MVQAASLTLTTTENAEAATLEASCLLAFVDETGDEGFSDPQHPVFGLGGCALVVDDYVSWVRPQWKEMKRQYFGGAEVPLHASDLRAPSPGQLGALSTFFKSDRFTRIVAVASSKTAFPDGHPPFQSIALCLLKRIERAALRFRLTSIALIVESSTRANSLVNQYLGPFDKVRIENDRGTIEAPIHRYFLPKYLNEPGMEVADFIMNAVGGQARSRLKNPSCPPRKDFAAIIHSVPQHAVEYLAIEKVEVNTP
jgi:hypothetical protein